MNEMKHVYVGRMRPERKGQPCLLVTTWRGKGKHNVLIRFADGVEFVTPMRGCVVRRKEDNAN